MKQEFCMTQEEMDMIIAINTDHTDMPVIKMFEGATSKQSKINLYWNSLASKYGFEQFSVEGSSRSKLHFLAEPSKKYETITVKCHSCDGSGKIPKKVEVNYTVVPDGDAWCCYGEGFTNLQESDNVEFGDTRDEAIEKFKALGE